MRKCSYTFYTVLVDGNIQNHTKLVTHKRYVQVSCVVCTTIDACIISVDYHNKEIL